MNALRSLLIWAVATVVVAASEVRDLGEGLGYLRLRDVEGDAFSVTAAPLVLDLRQASETGAAGAERIRALLAMPGVRLVLVSRATAPALIEELNKRPATALTIGGDDAPATDIRVSVSAEEDRKAYDALEEGVSLADLANPPLVKARRDEAAILQARRAASRAPEDPPPAAPRPPPPTSVDPAANPPAAAPTSDPVLQRAVQLHRGLRALKRI